MTKTTVHYDRMPRASGPRALPRAAGVIPARRDSRTLHPVHPVNPVYSAFTLLELLTSIVIIAVIGGIAALTFHRSVDGSVLALARNAVVAYAEVARSYAVANRIETMMVVNPYSGRFELWHLNPPTHGGSWSPESARDANGNPRPNGCMFADVFDASARLPLDSRGRPLALVAPIDFEPRIENTSDPLNNQAQRKLDRLLWTAFCFDEDGQLVVRSRRIATRTYFLRDRSSTRDLGIGPPIKRNRDSDEAPDLSIVDLSGALVTEGPDDDTGDTLITSTRGFIVSDMARLRNEVNIEDNTAAGFDDLVNVWLDETRSRGKFHNYAEAVVLNRNSGQKVIGKTLGAAE